MKKCTEKQKAYMREYYRTHKKEARERAVKNGSTVSTYMRAQNLKRNYGLTVEQFEIMLGEQGGCCLICKTPEDSIDPRTGKTRNLAVDHCHTTGKVRGLLCAGCNNGLGCFKDDTNRIVAALEYLETTCA